MPNGDANESHLSDVPSLESRVTKLEKDLGSAVRLLNDVLEVLGDAFPEPTDKTTS